MSRASRLLTAAAVLLAAAAFAVLTLERPTGDDEPPPREDLVAARVLGELDGFLDWLERHDADGVIGEISWPSHDPTGQWTALAERWLDRVADADVPAMYWAAGEVFDPDSIPYLAFASSAGPGTVVDTIRTPGELLIEHTGEQQIGLNSAGGSYNACAVEEVCDFFHADATGRYGREWRFDSTESLRFYATQGLELLRVEVRWERLQPQLDGPFDDQVATELERLLDDAEAHGLRVVLDLHNYGAYYVADGQTPEQGIRLTLGDELDGGLLTDIWLRIAERFGDHPAVAAYGLMNEPLGMGVAAWEAMSAATVGALRDRGDDTRILVGGYELSNVHSWPHRAPWIDDSNVAYEAHHHLDRFHGASYEWTYDEELEYERQERDATS